MNKNKNWLKNFCYFIVGFVIFILLSSITQINILKDLNINIDLKTVITRTIINGVAFYTVLYFLILILNMLYNIRLIKKLNETTEKIRKASKEKILKERRKITMKKKALIILLIITLIALSIFIFTIIRKANIIRKYSDKLKEYQNITNFYAKITYTSLKNNDIRKREIWKKDNITIVKDIEEDGTIRTNYFENNNILIFIDKENSKEYVKKEDAENLDKFIVLEDASFFVENNLWENITAACTTKITTEDINGKECYKFYISDNFQFIVDKENMLKIKEINGSEKMELVDYNIGNLTDDDLKVPNLEEYKLIT